MKFTKIASLILAVIMVFSLGITAFADDPETGSITINGVTVDVEGNPVATYAIYELLDLESYDTDSGAYSYTVNPLWSGFFATTEAKAYFAVDSQNYATWTAAEDDATVAAFAKLALAYAEANGIAPVKSSANPGEFDVTGTTGKFENLGLGYYLVDTTMGALCGLTTTNPNASVNAKNGKPTIDKQVKEDSTSQWGDVNTADIGQEVEFRVTINVHQGAQNYVLHDVMDEGFNFIKVTTIEHVVPGVSSNTVDKEKYTVKTKDDVSEESGKCTFEVAFSEDFCNELETNDKIVIHYTAMLNREAVINGEGNINTAWLTFGEGFATEPDQTITKTFGIDIVKTDSQNNLIDGAKFKIHDAAEGGNEVAVVLMDDGVTYRRARADETGVEIIVEDGQVRVVGFDNGTYYLEETEAPKGYNKITARQKFIISDGNLDATFNDGIFSTGSGVHVVNKTGTMLPETGGIGTTMFYVIGGVLVAGSLVFLVTKKRMGNQ
ncbi:MAG: SpaH/EbpB family LPXTG-anchored major pilin [Oscillospiraceae bacterium]|nr:SpaH/EbpB family LPXTG-anchored major pilin [Oscillospiraceae bacterium]MBQ6700563.1 SpaH/EbpB family LPXTG-anchored major pilin [Oscillospiraceae bacterium]